MAGPHLRSLSPAPTFPQPTSRARDGDGDVHLPSSSPTLSSADLDLVGLNPDGMFAILIPVSLSSLIITPVWAERRSKAGLVDTKSKDDKSVPQRILDSASRLDIPGLILIGTAVALILLPLALANNAKRTLEQWCVLLDSHCITSKRLNDLEPGQRR